MARQPATRLQLSGHRFLIRRMAHALVRGDTRMLDDPLRTQSISFSIGCVLAVVAITACLVLALVRPGNALGSSPIVLTRDSGALYVRIGDTMHPVLNLASARLIAGVPADPDSVSDAAVAAARRGPLVGIAGAPTQIDPPLAIDESGWSVCDYDGTTAFAAGRLDGEVTQLRGGQALLVAPHGESAATTYLLFDGWRAAVDLRNIAVVRALRMEGIAPLPVSRALLHSVPEAPPIQVPLIAGAGSPGPAALRGQTVGSVVQVVRTSPDTDEFYVVLADGLQRVSRIVADLIRFTVPQPAGEPPVIAADVVAAAPFVESLAVATFPQRVQRRAGAVVCAGWDPRQPQPGTNTKLLVGDSLPDAGLQLAQADGDGPNIDRVRIPPGRSALVRSTGLAGNQEPHGPLYLLNDLGVLFGIRDSTAAEHLGLTVPAVPAPWPMLAMLPRGPELSRDAASVVRDGLVSARATP
ncbi:type VII secretion protein EccB [Mycolicibacterium sp. XJ870]